MPSPGCRPGGMRTTGDGAVTETTRRIQTHLEALLTAGHADEVLSLGQELLKAGTQQVEMINDEGETAGDVVACMSNCLSRAYAKLAGSRRADAMGNQCRTQRWV